MKLTLDLSHPKLPKLFWIALLVVALWTIVYQIPASLMGGALASQTGCRVMLQQPIKKFWMALQATQSNTKE
jgi:hypothetical protein